jgi:hypothetical protein
MSEFTQLLQLYNTLGNQLDQLRMSVKECELKRELVRNDLKSLCPHVARFDERFPVCKVCGQFVTTNK